MREASSVLRAGRKQVSDRHLVWSGAAAAVIVAVAAAWALAPRSSSASEAGTAAAGTARVERRDLVVRETLDGNLGYADPRSLASGGAGTLTALAREGSVVRRGGILYSLNGRATRLLYGTIPAWRTLRLGIADGGDVGQLEENLVALGYDPDGDIEVDDRFDWATAAAIRRWEKARGVTADGVVELGEVVFLPGQRRMGEHRVSTGTFVQPGTEVAETTSTRRVVTVKLEATRQDLVREGDRVTVELPDGRTVAGRVTDVGRVAQTDETAQGGDGQGQGDEQEPYVLVAVTLGSRVRSFDQAPVDVQVAKERRQGVLSVPVEAVLALAGGGYAVEVVEGGVRRLVAVELGSFADGYVEVKGRGLREGMRVAVPR